MPFNYQPVMNVRGSAENNAAALGDRSPLFQTLTQSADQASAIPLLQRLMSRERQRHQADPPARLVRERGNVLQPIPARPAPTALALTLFVVPWGSPANRTNYLILETQVRGEAAQQLLVTSANWPWVADQFRQYLATAQDAFETAARALELAHYLAHLVAARCLDTSRAAAWLRAQDLPPVLPAQPAPLPTLLVDGPLAEQLLEPQQQHARARAASWREQLASRREQFAREQATRAQAAARDLREERQNLPAAASPGQPAPAEPRRRVLKRPS